ncbi:MAG: diguanylate cyclase [Curvibacter sp.]|jgi:diguanylate cyclase (GGDEF)-like protein|nr:diguanylate cyclase [Curvibacter sp.]
MNRRSLLSSLALMWLAILLMLAWLLKQSYDAAIERSLDHAEDLVQALQTQVSAAMRRAQSDLRQISQSVPSSALNQRAVASSRKPVEALLRGYLKEFPELGSYNIWDANGVLLYSTSTPVGSQVAPSIASRAAFQQLRDDPSLQYAHTEAIRGAVSGRLTNSLFMALRDAQGRLLAVFSAAIWLDRLADELDKLQLPERSEIFLRNSVDHRLIFRKPLIEAELNRPVNNPIQRRIDAGESRGRDRFQASSDVEWRIYAFRRLESHPFYIALGLAEEDALSEWRRNALIVAVGAGLTTLALAFTLWQSLRAGRERERVREEALQAHRLLQEAIDSISAGMVIYDAQDRFVTCNRAHRRLFSSMESSLVPGTTFEEIIREGLRLGLFPQAEGRQEEWLAVRLQEHRLCDGLSHEVEIADGRWLQVSEHRTPLGYIVGSRIDITERKLLETELRGLASTDALTGLANRRQFMQRLEDELERVRRQTTREACVLMLDLDHFKRVNDQYGHAAGDSLLRYFANLLRHELRITDTAGRVGGEEFALILPGSSTDAAYAVAQRICDKLASQPLVLGKQSVSATVSIGLAAIGREDLSADAVLSRADRALYQAKEAGRNRVQLASGPA